MLSLLALFAVAAYADTLNTPPTLPLNAQIGALRFPIACTLLGSIDVVLDATFTATAPVVAAPGQPVYFTDTTATIVTSGNVSTLAAKAGATSVDVRSFVDIDFTNASPSQFPVYPDGLWLNGTKIEDGQPITIHVPSSGVLGPIGPVTMGEAGQDVLIFIGALTAEIYLHMNGTDAVNGPLNITCPPQNNSVILGTLNVQGEPDSTPLSPANGYKPDFPDLPSNGEFGYYRVPYNCSIGDIPPMPLDLIFGGFLEGSYPAGSDFSFTNVTAYLVLDEALISEFRNDYGATSYEVELDSILVSLTHATPSVLNILGSPLVIGGPLPETGTTTLAIPQTGSLSVGPFNANTDAVGQYMFLALGDTLASVTLIDDADTCEIQTLPVSCSPYGALDLYGILVTPAQ